MPSLGRWLRWAAMVAVVATGTACPHSVPRPYPAPQAVRLVEHLRQMRGQARTLKAVTKTDAMLGSDRANVEVLILAAWGGKLRFMAMNPNNSLAADLAADGQSYCFIDTHANCGECGPSTPDTVARLIRIRLEPDDVVAVLMGGTPLLAEAQASVRWDSGEGHEILTLSDGSLTQTVVLDGRNQRWDVLSSELRDAKGHRLWRVQHTEFHEVPRGDQKTMRLPRKSRFLQGKDDVLIRWKEQELDAELSSDKFQLTLQEGLRQCGVQQP